MTTEKVFISHTSELSNWPPHRSSVDAAKAAVNLAEMVPLEMGSFGASAKTPRDVCLDRLGRASVYVGVIGFKFGSFVPGMSVSFTELEFDTAGELGLPRLMFLLRESSGAPVDADRTEIDRFRDKILKSGVTVDWIEEPGQFELRLYHALRGLVARRGAALVPTAGWVMAGQGVAAEVRAHFDGRGRGQRSRVGETDLFRGRQQARNRVGAWLTADEPPGRVMVVTGQPGAGKSAVVARAVLDLEAAAPEERGLAFHAREATVVDLLAGVASLAALPMPDSLASLLARLRQTPPPVLRIVVDALDEAASEIDRDQLVEAITSLAKLPSARVVVATRPVTAGNRFAPGTVFHQLGVRLADAAYFVDLDDDAYFDREGLRDFAAALLRQEGAAVPTPPDGAWRVYRSDTTLALRLAEAVAAKANRNYLVAALTADPLSQDDEPVDPDRPDFDPQLLATSVGEALYKYLSRQPVAIRAQVQGLLTALAYARGGGIEDALWLRFAEKLGVRATTMDLLVLRGGAAADYLLQTSRGRGAPLTRLFHQALVDELLSHRPERAVDEDGLLTALLPRPRTTWLDASDYGRSFAADHAAAAGRLTELLTDPVYPTVADLDRLLPLLPAEPAPAVAGVVAILRTAVSRARPLDHARRGRLLSLTAAHLGYPDLTTRFAHNLSAAKDAGPRATPVWAHSIGTPHQQLSGHLGRVAGLVFGVVAERPTLISCGDDRTIRLWDPNTGQELGSPLESDSEVRTVAYGRVDEREIIASGGADGRVTLWNPVTGQTLVPPIAAHDGAVLALAFGRGLVVSAGVDSTLRRWDPLTGEPVGQPLVAHEGQIRSVAVGRHDLRDVVVSGGYDGTVRAWDLATGTPVVPAMQGHDGAVWAVAAGRLDGRDVAVSGGADGTVRVWDLADGRPVGAGSATPGAAIRALAVGRSGTTTFILSAGDDAVVRVWDVASGRSLGAPLSGHSGGVRALAFGVIAGRAVVASAGDDGAIRLWDPYAGQVLRYAYPGHQGTVRAVAAGHLVHNVSHTWRVAVSAGADHTIRTWDALTGRPVVPPDLLETRHLVDALAWDSLANRELLAAADAGQLRFWDPRTGTEPALAIDTRATVHALAIVRDGNRRLLVSGDDHGQVHIWEPGRTRPLQRSLTGHTGSVLALAVGRLGKRDVAVSAGADGAVRLWDLVRGKAMGQRFVGHEGAVRAVALGQVGGRDVIVSAGSDGTLRLWDAHTGLARQRPLIGHEGEVTTVAIARVGDRSVVVSGGDDRTLRFWDPLDESVTVQDCYHPVLATALSGDLVIFAAGQAIGAISVA